MREIKFRAWNKELKSMSKPFSFGQVLNFNDKNIKSITDEIIMQLTDLKDKNGKEIYEGDVFKINSKIYFVEWNEDMSGFILTTGKGYDTSNMIDFNCDSICYSEIIGNIHENPELLK